MEQIPYVYIFKPGVRSREAVFRGIRNTLLYEEEGFHHWEVEDFSGSAPDSITGIVLKQKSGDQRIVLRNGNNEINQPTILCSIHPVSGESPINISSPSSPKGSSEVFITGNYPNIHLNSSNYLMSIEFFTIIEYPDAITIAMHYASSSNLWSFIMHAGRVLTPENRSDPYYDLSGFGIFCGLAFVQVNEDGTGTFTINGSPQTRYVAQAACVNQVNTAAPASLIMTQTGAWVNPQTFNRYNPLTAALRNVGDAADQDRLVPYRINQIGGHVLGSTRYVRQRFYGIGNQNPFISETSVSENEESDIAWAHRISSLAKFDAASLSGYKFSPNTIFAYNKNVVDLTGNVDI